MWARRSDWRRFERVEIALSTNAVSGLLAVARRVRQLTPPVCTTIFPLGGRAISVEPAQRLLVASVAHGVKSRGVCVELHPVRAVDHWVVRPSRERSMMR